MIELDTKRWGGASKYREAAEANKDKYAGLEANQAQKVLDDVMDKALLFALNGGRELRMPLFASSMHPHSVESAANVIAAVREAMHAMGFEVRVGRTNERDVLSTYFDIYW